MGIIIRVSSQTGMFSRFLLVGYRQYIFRLCLAANLLAQTLIVVEVFSADRHYRAFYNILIFSDLLTLIMVLKENESVLQLCY